MVSEGSFSPVTMPGGEVVHVKAIPLTQFIKKTVQSVVEFNSNVAVLAKNSTMKIH